MTIKTVTYQKTYSIGPYLTEKIGFEATPDEIYGDDPLGMLSMLEERADEWHKKAHPHLYQEPREDFFIAAGIPTEKFKQDLRQSQSAIPIISKDIERMEIDIDNAKTIEDLQALKEKYLIFPVPVLKLYNKKIEELSTGRPSDFTEGLT